MQCETEMRAEDNEGLSGPVLPSSGRLSTLLPTQSVAPPPLALQCLSFEVSM